MSAETTVVISPMWLTNAAIDQLNGKELDGRALTVAEAKPRAPRENRYGGGGGGGGGGRSSRW